MLFHFSFLPWLVAAPTQHILQDYHALHAFILLIKSPGGIPPLPCSPCKILFQLLKLRATQSCSYYLQKDVQRTLPGDSQHEGHHWDDDRNVENDLGMSIAKDAIISNASYFKLQNKLFTFFLQYASLCEVDITRTHIHFNDDKVCQLDAISVFFHAFVRQSLVSLLLVFC